MRELIRTALLFLSVMLFGGHAFASGDVGCYPSMKLFHKGFSGCDSLAFLAPGNDTRINLVYLMADAHRQKLEIQHHDKKRYPLPNDFAPSDWQNFSEALKPETATDSAAQETIGEGTICVSDVNGSAQFSAAVAAATDMSDKEKKGLSDARKALTCATGKGTATAPDVQSTSAKDFLAYLTAIDHFYKVDHSDASAFVALATSSQPWVKEAASYMQARTLLLAAQAQAFDDYGTMQKNKIDPAAVSKALDALDTYLKDYSNGAYAASATGLLRRAYWLGGNQSKQLETYANLIASKEVNEASLDVVNEMDFKLPIDAFSDSAASPILLAVQDFRLMREQTDKDGKPAPGMKAEVLEAQRSRFASEPELFDYLLAARA